MTGPEPAARHSPHALRYRPDIDGLRAVAVLCVVAFHAFPEWFPGGFIGVDVFFVISGFLITGIIIEDLKESRFSYARFYARRIRRIFPALVLVLLFSFAAGWFILLGDEFRQLGKHIAAASLFSGNLVLWKEAGYFNGQPESKPLLHLWSLGLEEQFYLIWPLLVVKSWQSRRSPMLPAALIGLGSGVLYMMKMDSEPVTAFYSPLCRFWELMLGCMLSCWMDTEASGKGRGALERSWLALLLIAATTFFVHRDISFAGWWPVFPVAAAVLSISAGSGAWPNRKLLANPWLVRIGLISYPLYLWHWPLLSFAHIMLSRPPSYGLRWALVAASFILARLTYAIEKPIRFGHVFGVVPILCILMVNVCCLGAWAIIVTKNIYVPRYLAYFPAAASAAGGKGDDTYAAALEKYSQAMKNDPDYLQRLHNERFAAIRNNHCHLTVERPVMDYPGAANDCLQMSKARKNVLIIGDSHAADLYAALSATHGEINFLQATADLCFPGPKAGKPCVKLLGLVKEFVVQNKPDAVILAGAWWDDSEYFGDAAPYIAELKAAGTKVILAGPPLQFTDDVYKIIARWPGGVPFGRYMDSFTEAEPFDVARRLRSFAKDHGVSYIDRTSYYCKDGCTALSADGQLLFTDTAHLSVAGDRMLGNLLLQGAALQKILASPDPLQLP